MPEAVPSFEERKLALEQDRLAFERERWVADQARGEKDVGSPWRSPLLIAILTAAAAAGGNAVVSRLNADGQVRLERLKGEQALITEMIRTGGDADKTRANLAFLLDTGLVTDRDRVRKMRDYLERTEARPELLPSLPTAGGATGEASVTERARSAVIGADCKTRAAAGGYCVENAVLIGSGGKPFELVDASRRTDKLTGPPMAIVLHFTAGPDGAAKRLFSDPGRPGSSHIEINRDGSITQFVPFDIVANHAGAGELNGVRTLNSRTIGIDLANWGALQGAPGAWRTYAGKPVPDAAVFTVTDPATGKVSGWERYTPVQLAALERTIAALLRAYPDIGAIVGHADVARPRGRKIDPGPALPMDRLRRLLAAPRN